nr:HAD family hydrolase [Faecalibaculum rodentium]
MKERTDSTKDPWLFASDFDNTLFFHDGSGFHEQDIRMIRAWQKAGNLFGICSGRSLHHLIHEFQPLFSAAGLTPDFFICTSGAILADGEGRVLAEHPLDPAVVQEAAHRCLDAVMVHNSEELFCLNRQWETFQPVSRIPEDRTFYGLSTWAEESRRINVAGLPLEAYVNTVTVDYVPAGVSKGTGILELCRILGLDPKKTAGMGDSWNDLPMIDTVSYGFTFPDGPNIVKKASAYEVDSIAAALEKVSEIRHLQTL